LILRIEIEMFEKQIPRFVCGHVNRPSQDPHCAAAMGGSFSTITVSSATAALDSYVAELGDVHYETRYTSLGLFLPMLTSSQLELCALPQNNPRKDPLRPRRRQNIHQTRCLLLPCQMGTATQGYAVEFITFGLLFVDDMETEERDALVDVPNAFPYIHCLETEKGGYLIRQYLYSSLYDRIRCGLVVLLD
jgi:phosphoinositide-3-kinase, regulatory subunit 4